MLLWTRGSRWISWLVFAVVFFVIFGLPLLTILLMGFAGKWEGVMPSHFTTERLSHAVKGDGSDQLVTSLLTGVGASLISLIIGTWAALVKARLRPAGQKLVDALFLIPIAVPSVVVGLGLLVAFSQKWLPLNGTSTIVLIAHTVLVTAFAYNSVSAGLSRLDPMLSQIAESLGARPRYVLAKVTLPLLLPSLVASAGLAFALSMGELGATIMVYPPGWVTMPVGISFLTGRGDVLNAGALTIVLLAATLVVLVAIGRVRNRSQYR